MADVGTQTSPPEARITDRKSFEWEHLHFDSEEICKVRFRHLLDKSSFLKENLVPKVNGIEAAVDFLYQANYVTSPSPHGGYERARMFENWGLSEFSINCRGCVLADPKLLQIFFCCYYDKEAWAGALHHVMQQCESEVADPFAKFVSFRVDNSDQGLRALWFWQCQLCLIRSEGGHSWAQEVEIVYNWVRFSLFPQHLSQLPNWEGFQQEAIRAVGRPINGKRLWWEVLCGWHCANPQQLPDLEEKSWDPTFTFKRPFDGTIRLSQVVSQYNLLHPPRPAHLSTEDVHEFDSAFISTGPFKFQRTDDIRKHLEFSAKDPNKIFVYFDGETLPAYSRGSVYERNLISGRQLKMDRLHKEIYLTYCLLFGQSSRGLAIAGNLLGAPARAVEDFRMATVFINIDRLKASPESVQITLWKGDAFPLPAPQLHVLMETDTAESNDLSKAFPILGPRLANLKETMRSWRPRRKRDLFKPGYADRFTYYTQLFALFIAIVGTLGVILSMVQTTYTVISAKNSSVQLAVDGVESQIAALSQKLDFQFAALLNVSGEILLALKALRTNGMA